MSSACRVIHQLRIKLPSTYSHSVLGSTWYAHSRTGFSAFSTNFLLALNRQLMLAHISNVGQILAGSVPAATAGVHQLQLRACCNCRRAPPPTVAPPGSTLRGSTATRARMHVEPRMRHARGSHAKFRTKLHAIMRSCRQASWTWSCDGYGMTSVIRVMT